MFPRVLAWHAKLSWPGVMLPVEAVVATMTVTYDIMSGSLQAVSEKSTKLGKIKDLFLRQTLDLEPRE